MRILAIDTSTAAASVALLQGGGLCCEYTLNDGKKHSEKLISLIDMVIKSCDLEVNDIDVFACSTGPGSFTGLRVGAAAIKGLAQALKKPIVGVPTLDALAYNLWGYKGLICPILDAQRDMVYSALYSFGDKELKKIRDFSAIKVDNLIDELNLLDETIVFLGDGVAIYKNKIKSFSKKFYFAKANNIYPRASSIASLAIKKYKNGFGLNYNEIKLNYIRKSQAEVEYEKKQNINIEVMAEKDIDEVLKIEELSFATPWTYDSFAFEILDNNLAKYIVAKTNDKIAGYAGMWFVLDEVHITNIAIHPDYRNRGIGDRLIKEIIKIANENSLRKITLEVRSTNSQAIYLYEKNGFKTEGTRKGYYADTRDDALIMWKELV